MEVESNFDDPLSIFKNLDMALDHYLSQNEVVENFVVNSNNNEMIGKIISITGPDPRTDKHGKPTKVINLKVKINSPDLVAVAIWGDEIPKFHPLLKMNHVTVFQGLYVTSAKKSSFNFERGINVTCQNNTQLYSLTDLNSGIEDRANMEIYTDIQHAINDGGMDKLIGLQAYLKINFSKYSGRMIGTLSDDKVNIESTIITYSGSEDMREGQYLKIFGKFTEVEGRINFVIDNAMDIEILSMPEASMNQLFQTLESPKKKRRNDS